jgi:hypothetical protein
MTTVPAGLLLSDEFAQDGTFDKTATPIPGLGTVYDDTQGVTVVASGIATLADATLKGALVSRVGKAVDIEVKVTAAAHPWTLAIIEMGDGDNIMELVSQADGSVKVGYFGGTLATLPAPAATTPATFVFGINKSQAEGKLVLTVDGVDVPLDPSGYIANGQTGLKFLAYSQPGGSLSLDYWRMTDPALYVPPGPPAGGGDPAAPATDPRWVIQQPPTWALVGDHFEPTGVSGHGKGVTLPLDPAQGLPLDVFFHLPLASTATDGSKEISVSVAGPNSGTGVQLYPNAPGTASDVKLAGGKWLSGWDPATMEWFRLTIFPDAASGGIRFAASPDGSSWTELGAMDNQGGMPIPPLGAPLTLSFDSDGGTPPETVRLYGAAAVPQGDANPLLPPVAPAQVATSAQIAQTWLDDPFWDAAHPDWVPGTPVLPPGSILLENTAWMMSKPWVGPQHGFYGMLTFNPDPAKQSAAGTEALIAFFQDAAMAGDYATLGLTMAADGTGTFTLRSDGAVQGTITLPFTAGGTAPRVLFCVDTQGVYVWNPDDVSQQVIGAVPSQLDSHTPIRLILSGAGNTLIGLDWGRTQPGYSSSITDGFDDPFPAYQWNQGATVAGLPATVADGKLTLPSGVSASLNAGIEAGWMERDVVVDLVSGPVSFRASNGDADLLFVADGQTIEVTTHDDGENVGLDGASYALTEPMIRFGLTGDPAAPTLLIRAGSDGQVWREVARVALPGPQPDWTNPQMSFSLSAIPGGPDTVLGSAGYAAIVDDGWFPTDKTAGPPPTGDIVWEVLRNEGTPVKAFVKNPDGSITFPAAADNRWEGVIVHPTATADHGELVARFTVDGPIPDGNRPLITGPAIFAAESSVAGAVDCVVGAYFVQDQGASKFMAQLYALDMDNGTGWPEKNAGAPVEGEHVISAGFQQGFTPLTITVTKAGTPVDPVVNAIDTGSFGQGTLDLLTDNRGVGFSVNTLVPITLHSLVLDGVELLAAPPPDNGGGGADGGGGSGWWAGFRHDDGALVITAADGVWLGGFVRAGGALSVVEGPGKWLGGFVRDPSGKLCVTQDVTGAKWYGGFLRGNGGSGPLVVTNDRAGAIMVGGFLRAPSGALVCALDGGGSAADGPFSAEFAAAFL